jgi:SpoIID/LytB domain protein
MLRTCGPTGNVRSYRGGLAMVASTTSASTWVVNTVAMEQYLRGVVPRESPASWGDSGAGKGINALKAQTVAARSYAWAENRSPGLFKTCDTTSCQVYGGAGLNGARIEDSRSDLAVTETAGEVRILSGKPARAEFSSSTGGHTAGGTFTAVPDAGDVVSSNPNHTWTTTVPVVKVQQAYPTIGTLQSIVVTARNGLGQDGGRARTVKVTGSTDSVTTTGDDLRSKLGLKSDWFYIADPTLNAPAVGLAGSGTGYVLTSTIGEAMSGAGGATFGSMEGKPLPAGTTIVAAATTPTGNGYWLAGSDGSIYRFGDAPDIGTLRGRALSKPIVGLAATKSGLGLWLVGSDGAVYPLGDAKPFGSMAGKRLNAPVLGMAADPDGEGYWLVARDGGVFSFNATFYGSTGNMRLNKPVLGMTADPTGHGYWFTASDGGVFTFIDQPGRFYGSAGATKLNAPIVGMAATTTGAGYWLLGRDGAIFSYGDAG